MTAADATRLAGEAYSTRLARGAATAPDDKTRIAQEGYPTFMSGSRDGEVVKLETAGSPPAVSIGRVAPCELLITDDPDLSRRHARIFWNGSSRMLEDLDSSNGTFLGEFRAARAVSTPTAIKDGQIFRVGLTRLRLGSAKAEPVATAAAAARATRI